MEETIKQKSTDIIKIAIYGPESTGKTTLSKALALHYNTVYTPEFAREYLQHKWDTTKTVCTQDDLMPIAIGQTQLENQLLDKATDYLFSDTCLLVTKVFSDIYYNSCNPLLEKAARKHKYDLFFLTDIDVQWEQDDLRDSPSLRNASFKVFEQALIDANKPYLKLSGNKEKRLQKAIEIIDQLKQAALLGLNSFDFVALYNRNITLATLKFQWDILRNGMPKTRLNRPATLGDGILSFSKEEITFFSNYFDAKKEHLKLLKFVPASGAASRMFKFLNEFIKDYKLGEESINAYINRKKDKNLSLFLIALDKFPFYEAVLLQTKANFPEYQTWSKDLKSYGFIKTMLSEHYFDFSNKPKGVLPFHKYQNHCATPIEEHMNEALYYAFSNQKAALHFTVSEEHQTAFEHTINQVQQKIEQQVDVTFSYQCKTTDTMAVDFDGNPFRDLNNQLVFRPGGHGALIENLNHLDADIVFIKNIDNVIQNNVESIALHKKALAGVLIETQERIFQFLRDLDQSTVSKETLDEILNFIITKIKITVVEDFSKYTKESKIDYLKSVLNRPIRVCGMVKNEGEPGGGPFWVTDDKGNVFLQIVESSQVDTKNQKQLDILQNATHFNPVDLVCGIKNYTGTKFDLKEFVDTKKGFLVEKNKDGKALKAYELPGLWNGAMAKWLTLFVEVPLITFNPVKTVNDLLKPAHQPD